MDVALDDLDTEVKHLSFSSDTTPLPSILVRKSYMETFDHIWAQAIGSDGLLGSIVTGQPGIGKTFFQYYLLVRLLQYKQVVLFHMGDQDPVLFFGSKVYTAKFDDIRSEKHLPSPKASSVPVFLWSLLDIKDKHEPKDFLVAYPCSPVQTTPPDTSRYKIWYKNKRPLVTGLPLWTRDELAQGLALQEWYSRLWKALCKVYPSTSEYRIDPLDRFPGARALLKGFEEEEEVVPSAKEALDYLLEEAIDHVGFAARDVFSAVFDFQSTISEHKAAASRLRYETLKEALIAVAGQFSVPDISHKILAISPIHHEPYVRVGWDVGFKSDWIARVLVKKLAEKEPNALRDQVRLLYRIPQGHSIAGQFLEPLAHRVIMDTVDGHWPLNEMISDNNTDSPTFTLNTSSVVHDVQFAKVQREVFEFEDVADISAGLRDNVYYVPVDPTFLLWVLQMSTSRLHGGSALGYVKIRKILAILKKHLAEVPPPKKTAKVETGQTSSRPRVQVRYLFVTPKGNVRKQWHFPQGWNKNSGRYDHRGVIYSFEIPISVCPAIVRNAYAGFINVLF
ncbi:hypothetical protein CPB84DRAFT_1771816 [Gymnopilus junonius]|uniref:Uncharacterized protein n=1 Tax=Gymnopilus junonius TaxID=109634 RepID=A0A9P5TR67_GYMJU|nr:hypothetical protein CPB84DRAFT_1771816 [Gymnopilus junonius]